MEKYRFPLQRLLDMRMDKEEQSTRKFIESQRDKERAEQKLNDMKESYAKYNRIDRQESIIEQKIKLNYLSALSNSMQDAAKDLVKKEAVLETNRADLKQKQIERKTVEIIKEKREEAFIKEQDRIEQINNDEFALYSFMRNIERR